MKHHPVLYRGYKVEFNPKPGPPVCDWDWVHQDYDGPGDRRCGAEHSREDCFDAIDELEDDA